MRVEWNAEHQRHYSVTQYCQPKRVEYAYGLKIRPSKGLTSASVISISANDIMHQVEILR